MTIKENTRKKAGSKLESDALRIGWTIANFVTGVLAIVLAWSGG